MYIINYENKKLESIQTSLEKVPVFNQDDFINTVKKITSCKNVEWVESEMLENFASSTEKILGVGGLI